MTFPTFQPFVDSTLIMVSPTLALLVSFVYFVEGGFPYRRSLPVTTRCLFKVSEESTSKGVSDICPISLIVNLFLKGLSSVPACKVPFLIQMNLEDRIRFWSLMVTIPLMIRLLRSRTSTFMSRLHLFGMMILAPEEGSIPSLHKEVLLHSTIVFSSGHIMSRIVLYPSLSSMQLLSQVDMASEIPSPCCHPLALTQINKNPLQ